MRMPLLRPLPREIEVVVDFIENFDHNFHRRQP